MKKMYPTMFFISLLLMVASIAFLFTWGLKFGADFKGGTVMEIQFTKSRPAVEQAVKTINAVSGVKDAQVSPSGSDVFLIRMNSIDEKTHAAITAALKKDFGDINELRFDSIGPTIGRELRNKSIWAMALLLLAIIVYIAIVFRKMRVVVAPWVMGVAAVFALIHDLLIPMGAFAVLGHFMGIDIGAVFVAAALTILGYSVSDTVVIFDRVRENVLRYGSKQAFSDIVHASILQTLSRSINTTLTTLLALIAIFLFGGETLRFFALALIIGIFCGAYSSMFIASPILMWWHRRNH